ncbi:type II toxin-antitoxin system prevent-host-death family antitoxin [Variovorax sp. Root434]|uniref:type II toxin-antitoxin system prevent-host-death family antitoxin n=1 Tax=unclassified Variovorax TaxID=663243 RepID=UPI0006FAE792|nr:type II toxin-antitoxin system prevent-host-death family antitoxin [Variovorax sp. Root434]KQX22027.1 prevent-host-death protein [Variovorax sp. Root434]
MKTWSVQKAEARFGELLEACLVDGPQMITKHGTETAVLVPAAWWLRSNAGAEHSLKELLLCAEARTEFLVPPRGVARRRRVALLR